jgi:hypothetical protein
LNEVVTPKAFGAGIATCFTAFIISAYVNERFYPYNILALWAIVASAHFVQHLPQHPASVLLSKFFDYLEDLNERVVGRLQRTGHLPQHPALVLLSKFFDYLEDFNERVLATTPRSCSSL